MPAWPGRWSSSWSRQTRRWAPASLSPSSRTAHEHMKRLLIANRGEIALRIVRAARDLGIETVAVFSLAGGGAAHVRLADSAVPIGKSPVGKGYLRGDAIVEAAISAGADAIHPGYGLLSERAEFARACETAGLTFVGPDSDT